MSSGIIVGLSCREVTRSAAPTAATDHGVVVDRWPVGLDSRWLDAHRFGVQCGPRPRAVLLDGRGRLGDQFVDDAGLVHRPFARGIELQLYALDGADVPSH